MIISEQQVRLALEYLHTQPRTSNGAGQRFTSAEGISDEFVARVRRQLEDSPATRDDRVATGRALLESAGVTGDEVAAKMIGRIISDSIR